MLVPKFVSVRPAPEIHDTCDLILCARYSNCDHAPAFVGHQETIADDYQAFRAKYPTANPNPHPNPYPTIDPNPHPKLLPYRQP